MTEQRQTLAQEARRRARLHPHRTAFIFTETDGTPNAVLSYGQLWHNAQALARGLRQHGLRPGEMWATLMPNCAEFVELLIASVCVGAVLVPIDPRTRGQKLSFMLRSVGAVALVAADTVLAQAADVMHGLPSLRWVAASAMPDGPDRAAWPADVMNLSRLRIDGLSSVEEFVGTDDPMEILFTSGTTGEPKGVVMTHGRFCASSKAALSLFDYQNDDRLYSGLSLTHANAQIVTFGAALFGGLTAVFSRRFTKSRLWDIARQHGCTSLTLLGGMTTGIYAEPRRPEDARNPVRRVVSAGMPVALWRAFEKRFGVEVIEFYGSAEGGLAVNPAGIGPIGSCGRIAPGFVARVVDPEGRDVKTGDTGELLIGRVDGAPIRVDYVGNPAASESKCTGGWLHMGDVVSMDADGWLYFAHRKGGEIRRNGDFINTAFIERVIAEIDAIADVYVYGIPAASGAPGEKDVVAAVVPLRAAEFDPQLVFGACRRALEPNFVPSYIQIVAEIPKTASEKPQDRFLIEEFHSAFERVHIELK